MEYSDRRLEFFKTATVRQCIWYKKEILKAPKPWTTDERYLSIFFCNVFRKQDKTTIVLETALAELKAKGWDDYELFKWTLVFRQLSRIDAIEYCMKEIIPHIIPAPYGSVNHQANSEIIDVKLKERVDSGFSIFTGGFLTSGTVGNMVGGKSNIPGYLYRTVDPAIWDLPTIEQTWHALNDCPGIGGFMAYEYVTDFSYRRDYPDFLTWANPGPGANRGMQRVTRDFVRCNLRTFNEFARGLLKDWKAYIDSDLFEAHVKEEGLQGNQIRPTFKNLSMRECEHWLCEFDKYDRKTRNRRTYAGS